MEGTFADVYIDMVERGYRFEMDDLFTAHV